MSKGPANKADSRSTDLAAALFAGLSGVLVACLVVAIAASGPATSSGLGISYDSADYLAAARSLPLSRLPQTT